MDEPMFVFVARRRPDSFEWEIPLSDNDLMSGVGARNTRKTKGDDTFETLLLMGLCGEDNLT